MCMWIDINNVFSLLLLHYFILNENAPLFNTDGIFCIFDQVVEFLIQSNLCKNLLFGKPEEDMADNNRTTCLHLAAKNGHYDVIRYGKKHSQQVDQRTFLGLPV